MNGFFSTKARQERYRYWRSLTFAEIWPMLAAAFVLFAVVGLIGDLFDLGTQPIAIVLFWSVYSGCNAVAFLLLVPRYPRYVPLMIGVQLAASLIIGRFTARIVSSGYLPSVDSAFGVRLAGGCALAGTILSYVLFLVFLQKTGVKSLRALTELSVAHGIQRRLVPVLDKRNETYEVYSESRPSERWAAT
jgi:hypothetical protein